MKRYRTDIVWVIVLIAIMAMRVNTWGQRFRGPATTVLNIRGVTLGMSANDVTKLLGKPATISRDGTSWMYYFGLLAVANEFLGVHYGPDNRVWAVEGEQISRGSKVIAHVNDNEAHLISVFGPLRNRVRDSDGVKCEFDGLTVFLTHNQVFNITLETPQFRAAELKRESPHSTVSPRQP